MKSMILLLTKWLEISKEKIEQTMQYPGTIKVTVVRETRAQEEAR